MGMTFYTRGLALDSRHPRFIPLRIAGRRPRLVVTCAVYFSPVVMYHGLARRHLMHLGFLMRPLLNGGTLGGRGRVMANPVANWALLYKYDEGCPSEFREIRWFGDTVFNATGRVNTWGEEGLLTLQSRQEALGEYERLCRSAQDSGFELTRCLTYDPASFDAARLATEVTVATRNAVGHVRRVYPDKSLNAFALLTDSGAMTLALVSGTVDSSAPPLESDSVWNCSEWSEFHGSEYFDVAYRIILAQHRGLESQVEFAEFCQQMFESCIRSLEGLVADGLFGDASQRENVVILFQVSDDDEIDGAMVRLNTTRVVERYRAWRLESALSYLRDLQARPGPLSYAEQDSIERLQVEVHRFQALLKS